MVRNFVIAVFMVVVGGVMPMGSEARAWDDVLHDDIVSDTPSGNMPRVLDGEVWAIAQWGDLVVVGGTFSTVKVAGGADIPRSNIFAFWRDTGAIDGRFAPTTNGSVRSIAIDPQGRGIFVGGQFGVVNGDFRRGLVFLDRDGQRIRNWPGRPNGSVAELAVLGDTLYVGGSFTKFNGQASSVLVSIGVADGQLNSEFPVVFSNPRYPQYQGRLEIRRFEISPDNQRLVVIGNFQFADGQYRDQVAVIDVGSSPDRVAAWSTNFFDDPCNGSRSIWPYFVRDVSISPDNSYFAIATVGGPGGSPPNPCDNVSRFELADGLNRSPTWVNYSGGDSVTSVEISGPIVYVGGHFRWMNNGFGNNRPGPGSVARNALAALNPSNGAVLGWDPGRQPRGHGVLVMESSPDGLWLGHDTAYVNGVYSPRLTFLALPTTLSIDFDVITNQQPGPITISGSVNSGTPITTTTVSLTNMNGQYLQPDGTFQAQPANLDATITGLGTANVDIFYETILFDAGTYTVHVSATDAAGVTITESTDVVLEGGGNQLPNIRIGAGLVGNDYNISSGSRLNPTRDTLLDTDNFGPAGTVEVASISIVDDVDDMSQDYLDSIDILFDGFVSNNEWSLGELVIVEDWVRDGGVLIATSDDPSFDALAEHFGNPVRFRTSDRQWSAAQTHPITDGPFGTWSSITGLGRLSFFEEVPGWDVVARNQNGRPTIATIAVGQGQVIITGDAGIFRSGFPGDGETMAANLFAFAIDSVGR